MQTLVYLKRSFVLLGRDLTLQSTGPAQKAAQAGYFER